MSERKELAIPDVIFLQWYGDGDPQDGGPCEIGDEVTWCSDSIFEHDIKYVRASLSLLEGREQPQGARVKELERDIAQIIKDLRAVGFVPGPKNRIIGRGNFGGYDAEVKLHSRTLHRLLSAPTKEQEGDE